MKLTLSVLKDKVGNSINTDLITNKVVVGNKNRRLILKRVLNLGFIE